MIVSWFSAGITSTIATKLVLDKYGLGNVDIVFFETGAHHRDNKRFIKDCEQWFGKEIEVHQNPKYASLWSVLEKGFINSPGGAYCTHELKKKMRWKLEKERVWTNQVFGFEYQPKEIRRAQRFMEQYPDTNPVFPLIESQITKKDCIKLLSNGGIEIPEMYRLGYSNNNCVGCVKGGMGYWNKIRVDFPEVFKRMAELEREVGATCLKDKNGKLFLDELDPSRGKHEPPITGECGVFCPVEDYDESQVEFAI